MSSQARLRHLSVAALSDATPDLSLFFSLFLFVSKWLQPPALFALSSEQLFFFFLVVVSVKCQLEKLIRTPPRSSAPSPSPSALYFPGNKAARLRRR